MMFDRLRNSAALLRLLPLAAIALQTASAASDLAITEADLRAYDGTDASKPIYLAIRGTIFDVSASPAFYGPGGHYHHFTGRDATRAWVTECWDDPAQLTWRMDHIEAMYTPMWMDEEMERMGKGDLSQQLKDVKGIDVENVAKIASKAAKKFGSVSDETKEKRRVEDQKEAELKVKEVVDRWYSFFADNPKYMVVGHVVKDEEGTPPPPEICDQAMTKRPVKGGKMEALMAKGANVGQMMGQAKGEGKPEKMPDHLKNGKPGKNKDEL